MRYGGGRGDAAVSEEVHAQAVRLDALSTREVLELLQAEDRRAVDAVQMHIDEMAAVVEAVASRLRAGGTLHYFGAGTSGRLAELDALETGPTFGIDAVRAHSAGDGAAEDDGDKGSRDASNAGLRTGDAVIGVSASGRTPYVVEAMKVARAAGALIVTLSCAAGAPLSALANIAIEIDTGPEVIAGSTRLKAGTVQKTVLNTISTAVFVRLGRTYRGRMVGVAPANAKLKRRAVALIRDLADATPAGAERALDSANGNARVAILMLRLRITAEKASGLLAENDGDLAAALGERARL